MDKKRIRQQAEERIGYGYTRQHVFDELMLERPAEKPQRVADIVRNVPSLMARQAYRGHHQLLLLAVAVGAALQIARPVLEGAMDKPSASKWVGLVPLASIFLGIGVYRWRGETFQWLALVNIWGALGLMGKLDDLVRGDLDGWTAARYALTLTVAGLGLFLWKRVFPKYTVQTVGGAQRIVFPPEPGMHPY